LLSLWCPSFKAPLIAKYMVIGRYTLLRSDCNRPHMRMSVMDAPVTPDEVPNLPRRQKDLLRILRRSPKHIRQMMSPPWKQSPSGLKDNLKKLEKLGYVQARRDGSTIKWELTDAGRNHLFVIDELGKLDGEGMFRHKWSTRGTIKEHYWLNPKTNMWERLQPP
jgi:DNA-binding MarR family transcriptional regulator